MRRRLCEPCRKRLHGRHRLAESNAKRECTPEPPAHQDVGHSTTEYAERREGEEAILNIIQNFPPPRCVNGGKSVNPALALFLQAARVPGAQEVHSRVSCIFFCISYMASQY